MSYALGTHTTINGAGTNTATSAAIDTSGMSFLAVAVGLFAGHGTPTITDSKTNTWHVLTGQSTSRVTAQLWYAWNPTVGTGHTFTVTAGVNIFFSGCVASFSGAQTASDPFDVQNGGISSNGATTVSPGAVTPSVANELILTAMGIDDPAGSTITQFTGYNITDTLNDVAGSRFGCSLAYLIQTSASSTTPTWTRSAGSTQSGDAAVVATFKAAAGGGGRTLFTPTGLDGLSTSGPKQFNPSLGYHRTPNIALRRAS